MNKQYFDYGVYAEVDEAQNELVLTKEHIGRVQAEIRLNAEVIERLVRYIGTYILTLKPRSEH
jgi:hypothetical protein